MRFAAEPTHAHDRAERTGILLINLGTPDAPTPKAVRRYLAEFLSDPRVVEIPRIVWWPILHGAVLRTRPSKSAAKALLLRLRCVKFREKLGNGYGKAGKNTTALERLVAFQRDRLVWRRVNHHFPRLRIDEPNGPDASREIVAQLPFHFAPRIARADDFDGQVAA